MTTTSGEKRLEIYVNHLVNAKTQLLKLPNRYYRSREANELLNQHQELLTKLIAEIERLRSSQGLD